MKKLLLTLLVTIMLVNADDSREIKIDEEEGEPPLLTTAMFDDQVLDKNTLQVKGGKPWFIKFYAPWCGHCKKLAPTWKKLHEEHGDKYNIARVDCTTSETTEVCQQLLIRGYPSLILFTDGKMYPHRGRREMENLVEFAAGGYLNNKEEHIQEIPKRLEGFEKFKRDTKGFFTELSKAIDKATKKYGLDFIPLSIRLFVCLLFVVSPMIAVCAMLVMSDDEVPAAAPKKQNKVADAKVAPQKPAGGKREKLE